MKWQIVRACWKQDTHANYKLTCWPATVASIITVNLHKKSSALLCPSNVPAIYHLPYVSHYQRKTTIFVVRCSGFIFNYSDNPTRNLFITQYRQNVFKNPCVTNMKTNIWKYFLPLFREIVALLDKRSHLRDVHAVNNLLHVSRITLWTQGTQYQLAAKRYYLACLMFLFPICFMIES